MAALSFKFNFSNDAVTQNDKVDNALEAAEIKWLESNEHKLSEEKIIQLDKEIERASILLFGDHELKHLTKPLNRYYNGIDKLNANESEHVVCDLKPGVYEGGLKIWECTKDLLDFMFENVRREEWNKCSVLDLGCGSGLLGIAAMILGVDNVIFQDYNKEVLEAVTMPNTVLNLFEEDEKPDSIQNCTFYSGDWGSFNEKLGPDKQFDCILTSETIYNLDNYSKLIKIFRERLKEDGKVFLAAKTCYFGVGGGTRLFEEAIKKDGDLQSEVVWRSHGGIQREILKICLIR